MGVRYASEVNRDSDPVNLLTHSGVGFCKKKEKSGYE